MAAQAASAARAYDATHTAFLSAAVRRESQIKHVLRRLPPTSPKSVQQADGTLLLKLPPPTAEEWEAAVDLLGPIQLSNLDAVFRQLLEAQADIDDAFEALQHAAGTHDTLLVSFHRHVCEFNARMRLNKDAPSADVRALDTIAIVRHSHIVKSAHPPAVSLSDVFGAMLLVDDDSRFRELPELEARMGIEAANVERTLRAHDWLLNDQLVENVATNPWVMRPYDLAHAVRRAQIASADMHNGVERAADRLREIGQAASDAECQAAVTRLSQEWVSLDAAVEANGGDTATTLASQRARLERARLERFVAPLLHRRCIDELDACDDACDDEFGACTEFGACDADAPLARDAPRFDDRSRDNERMLRRMGRRSDAERAVLEEAHAKLTFELAAAKEDAYSYLLETRMPLLIRRTMEDVRRHFGFAHRILAQLPSDQRPPKLADPDTVMAALARAYSPGEWLHSPRRAEVVDDAITFVFQWLCLSNLTETYRTEARACAEAAAAAAAPAARGARCRPPLPTLRAAAEVLAARCTPPSPRACYTPSPRCTPP